MSIVAISSPISSPTYGSFGDIDPSKTRADQPDCAKCLIFASHPSHRPVSALRARMIEDMRVRGFTEKTRSDYIRNVRALAAFIGRPPDTATAEDLRRFQLHQTQTGMQPPSINSAVAALPRNAYSGATIRSALRGAKVKFKGVGWCGSPMRAEDPLLASYLCR
jgi:hypothetical protein